MVGQIYPTELQLNKTNSSETEAPVLTCFELFPVHRYSVDIFAYSGPSGMLGADRKQNTT